MSIYVYWIHYQDHSDPLVDGYVGVSVDPYRRFRDHKRGANNMVRSALANGAILSILIECEESSEAYDIERTYRPTELIGWNIAAGGLGGAINAKPPEWYTERNNRRYSDPLEREKTALATKKRYLDPAERQKTSDKIKSFWQNPEYIKKQKAPKIKNMCGVVCEGTYYASVKEAEAAYPGHYIRRRFDSDRWPEFYRIGKKVRRK